MIGGGVVGLAIARKLAQALGTSTVLLERHNAVGTETSSRNSEVYFRNLHTNFVAEIVTVKRSSIRDCTIQSTLSRRGCVLRGIA